MRLLLKTILTVVITMPLCIIGLAANKANHLFQVATIGSLTRGVYDGDFHYKQLFSKGTQGLGTFEAIDGEMVALEGNYYQIKANGEVNAVDPDAIVPFAEVINFKATHTVTIANINNYDDLMSSLEKIFKNKNIPYVFQINGHFKHLQLRSLKKQAKPYPSLVDASKNQAIFNESNMKGTIVGFWFPSYWAGIAVPGFHLHFINDEKTLGGHILDLSSKNAMLSYAPIYDFTIHLPATDSFAAANLDPKSLHEDIKAAEGGVKE